MSSKYTKHIEYRFEVCDELIAIIGFGEDWVEVEEVRKNGQEDGHMVGLLEIIVPEKGFDWSEGKRLFDDYGNEGLADAIRDYINEHGLPSDVNEL